MRVRIRRLPGAHDLPLPEPASAGSSGYDLRAAVAAGEPVTLVRGERRAIPTGLALEIPPGFEGQVRPRSGLAARHGIAIVNAPGTIDSDYRGEIAVLLINLGQEPFTVKRGERIAQLVFARTERVEWDESEALEESARGEGGFGSTGVG